MVAGIPGTILLVPGHGKVIDAQDWQVPGVGSRVALRKLRVGMDARGWRTRVTYALVAMVDGGALVESVALRFEGSDVGRGYAVWLRRREVGNPWGAWGFDGGMMIDGTRLSVTKLRAMMRD